MIMQITQFRRLQTAIEETLQQATQHQQQQKEKEKLRKKRKVERREKKNLSIYKTRSRQGPRVCLSQRTPSCDHYHRARLMESSPKIGMDFVFPFFILFIPSLSVFVSSGRRR